MRWRGTSGSCLDLNALSRSSGHSSSGQEIPDTHPPAARGPIGGSAVDLVEHREKPPSPRTSGNDLI